MKYNRICQILGIEKPVIQGPLSWLTDARLVAAVSNAGGLGVLGPNAGLTAETAVSTPEETAEKMREEIRKTKKLTEKPFGVNLIPTPENDIWTPPILQVIKEEGVKAVVYTGYGEGAIGDMLGLLTGNLADPFFARLARGVEDVSRKQQYRLMVCSGGHDEEMEKAGLDFLVNQGCEAIVVHASRLPDKELLRYAAHFPALVVVNRYIAGMANRCIWLENRSAAREATRYLLANGHRRIACVTSDLPIIDRQERLDGYREALEEYGISPDPRWVISVPFNEEGGERAAHQLINSGLPLTAAVTFNDVMAAGIMRILHQRGVQLPQQLSIVGFDDVVLARYLYPALTTMHYPVEQMARCAAQLAIQLYQGITPPPSSNHFNAELVIRDSVAPYFSR